MLDGTQSSTKISSSKKIHLLVISYYLLVISKVTQLHLKGNKGPNPYLTSGFIGKIQVSFTKCVLFPDMVIFEI